MIPLEVGPLRAVTFSVLFYCLAQSWYKWKFNTYLLNEYNGGTVPHGAQSSQQCFGLWIHQPSFFYLPPPLTLSKPPSSALRRACLRLNARDYTHSQVNEYTQGDLNNKIVFSHSSGDGKYRIKMPAELSSDENSLLNLFSSVAHSCPTLCDPMNHSTPGLTVHRQLPESSQTHVHRASDAIQPSHPLSPPSPPAPNPSQHEGLFQ